MPVIANPFQIGRVTDLSETINLIPNQWGFYNNLGLFTNTPKAQKVVLVPRTNETEAILEDRNWDERNNTIKGPQRDYLALQIPHYPVDDMITPNDVDGQVDWDSLLQGGNSTLSVDKVRVAKMDRIRRAHSLTLEYARAQVIRDGTVYAPNGTVVTNYYTEFGITRQSIPFNLTSTTVNPIGNAEVVIAALQDNLMSGEIVSDFLVVCSPEFFNALISNPFVYESYQYFAQNQGAGILNQRLSSGPRDARYRQFVYGGLTFVEVRGQIAGVPYVTPGEAYAFPMGTDSFRTYFAPANRFDTVNRVAQESYMFEKVGEWQDKIEIMTETNFLNAILRPQSVVTLTID